MERNTGWKRIVYLMCAIQVGAGIAMIGVMAFLPLFLVNSVSLMRARRLLGGAHFRSHAVYDCSFRAFLVYPGRPPRPETCHVHRPCGGDTDSVSLRRIHFAVAGVYLPPAAGLVGGFVPIGLSVIASVSPEEETSRTLGYFQAAMVSGIMFGPLVEVLWQTRWGTACPLSSLASCP